MEQKRSIVKPGAMRTKGKRLILLSLLVIVPILLSGCYTDSDPTMDGNNGLGGPAASFDPIITPTPAATPTQTIAPASTDSPQSTQASWDSGWTFGQDPAATQPGSIMGNAVQPTPGGVITPSPQPGASVGPSPSVPSDTLKSGSEGDEVTRLQTELKRLGYYSGTVDGKYGPGTASAVKDFQSVNGLSADGAAGPRTLSALYSYLAKEKPANMPQQTTSSASRPTNTPRPQATATPRPGRTDIYLRLGSTGDQVRIAQNRLIALGYLSGSATGQFQESTQAAVTAFQRNNSLDSDGVAGPTTLSKLYSSSAKKASRAASHVGSSLRQGTNGEGVRALQRLLQELGYYKGSIDGDYGAATTAAVTAFQSANGLQADGVAGEGTMNALHNGTPGSTPPNVNGGGGNRPETYGASARIGDYSTISSSSGTSTANVTNLQSVLASFGFYRGELDGKYGGGTTSAVSDYQRANGLRVTGMAGPATQRRIYNSSMGNGSYRKLERGTNNSSDVQRLQYTLYELMYYDGNITGNYDDATYYAVALFQRVNGLQEDGVAGEATQRMLYSSSAKPNDR